MSILLLIIWLQAAAPPADGALSEFSPPLRTALQAYQAGAYDRAQPLAADIAGRTGDSRVRRDARLLQALVLLRQSDRAAVHAGRAQLADLSTQDPQLLERAEVLLAAGIGARTLGETAAALDQLDRAVDAFAALHDSQRLPEAVRALAQAWIAHTEWSATPPRLGVPPIDSAAQVEQLRERALRALIRRSDGFEPAAKNAAQLELAGYLAQRGQDQPAAELLISVTAAANGAQLDEARFALAQVRERAGAWAQAHELYQRVASTDGPLSSSAAARASELARPEIDLSAIPSRVPPDARIPLAVALRGVRSARLEVRHIDLEKLLRERRGRLPDSALPLDGAVRFTCELPAGAQGPFDRFLSLEMNEPPRLSAPAGAYVVSVQGQSHDGGAIGLRRLLLVSNLRAAARFWANAGIVTALPESGTDAPLESAEALFWMQGATFVPARTALGGGAAILALPNEARIARVRNWICLVRAGGQLALCEGELPRREDVDPAATAVLVVAPPVIAPGAALHVGGIVMGAPTVQANAAAPAWTVDLVDSEGAVLATAPATVTAAGVLSARVAASPAWTSSRLALVLRRDGQVVENARGRIGVRLSDGDDGGFEVQAAAPDWLPLGAPSSDDAGPLAIAMHAAYPWGVPVQGSANGLLLATQVPDLDAGRLPLPLRPRELKAELDESGRAAFAIPLDTLSGITPPLGINVSIGVTAADGRARSVNRAIVAGERSAYAWLSCEPAQPRAGQPLRLFVGVLDPAQGHSDDPPEVSIHRGEEFLDLLTTEPTPRGFATQPFTPPPGDLICRTQIAALHAQDAALSAALHLPVAAPEHGTMIRDARARFSGGSAGAAPQVTVIFDHDAEHPPLCAALVAGDPLAAVLTPPTAGEVALDSPPELPADACVLLAQVHEGEFRTLAVLPIERPAPRIAFDVPDQLAPGSVARVRVRASLEDGSAASGAVVARLIDSADVGTLPWSADFDRADFSPANPAPDAAAELLSPTPAGRSQAADRLRAHPALLPALLEGATLWTGTAELNDGDAQLDLPLPPRARRYRLIVYLPPANGRGEARGAAALDAREAHELMANLPDSLLPGDRTIAVVRLTAGSAAAAGTLRLDGGAALAIEQVRLPGGEVLKPDAAGTYPVELPPRGEVRLLLTVEALRPAPGLFQASFLPAGGGLGPSISQPYSVSATPRAETAQVRVKRELFHIVSRRGDRTPARILSLDPRAWELRPLEPQQRLDPGQFVLVREHVSNALQLPQGIWSQRAPVNCHTLTAPLDGLRLIGQPRRAPGGTLQYVIAPPTSAEITHEYVLYAIRPGACLMSPPLIEHGAAALTPPVDPADMRIIVSE